MISTNTQKEVWEKLNSIERRLLSVSQTAPPVDAQYVVMALNAVLTGERRLQASEGIALTDGGAGGDADLALDINGLVEDAGAKSGDFFVYYDTDDGVHYKLDYDDLPGGGGGGYWTQVGVDIYYDDGGSVTVGTNAPDSQMTEGITIFQGTSDDNILTLQSSDIATNYPNNDSDTFCRFKKHSAASGGVAMAGYAVSGHEYAVQVMGAYVTGNTTKTTAGAAAPIELLAIKGDNAGAWTGVGDGENLVKITYYTGTTYYGAWWVDENGNTYQAGDFYCGDQADNQTPQLTIRRRDSNNIWMGINGGAAWTTGDRNYSLGDYALDAINSGYDNIGIGYNAGTALTSGIQNIAIGHDALEAAQTVYNCIAIGRESLESHTSGNGVIAIGSNTAWQDSSVPQFNIYIGHEAAQTSTGLGANQIAIGYRALQNCSGAENIAIGYIACSTAVMTGASNTVIGSQAGPGISSGAQNTIVGADAGDNLDTGSDNVAIGYQAGDTQTTGSQCIFLGSQADAGGAPRANSIAIGYNVSLSADNQIIIGNASHTAGRINCGDLGINYASPGPVISAYDAGTSSYLHLTHSGTGQTANDGVGFGIDSNLRLVIFNHENERMQFTIAGTVAMRIEHTSYAIYFPNWATESLKILDAGSAAATEQDWIEVEVGGNQGYLHVFAAK